MIEPVPEKEKEAHKGHKELPSLPRLTGVRTR